MSTAIFVGSLVLLSLVGAGLAGVSGADYTECQNSSQCGSGRCCILVNGRYPTTACGPLRGLGEQCRASSNPMSQSLQFPGGASVHVTDVYYGLCPCAPGNACQAGKCSASSANSLRHNY